MTTEQEEKIRKAMIGAGYGWGFSLRVDVDRLHDYAKDPKVAQILQEES